MASRQVASNEELFERLQEEQDLPTFILFTNGVHHTRWLPGVCEAAQLAPRGSSVAALGFGYVIAIVAAYHNAGTVQEWYARSSVRGVRTGRQRGIGSLQRPLPCPFTQARGVTRLLCQAQLEQVSEFAATIDTAVARARGQVCGQQADTETEVLSVDPEGEEVPGVVGGPSAKELLDNGPRALTVYLEEHPEHAGRIQAEMRGIEMLSPRKRRSQHRANSTQVLKDTKLRLLRVIADGAADEARQRSEAVQKTREATAELERQHERHERELRHAEAERESALECQIKEIRTAAEQDKIAALEAEPPPARQ